MLLAAGHRDDAVEQNLEGDVRLGRHRETYGERARMVIGAVAEILEHMGARRERRLADPVGALSAHVGVALGRAPHPLRHVMATDAGIGARALWHMCRGAMRTARAKMRNAHRHLGEVSALLLQSLEPRDAPLQLLAAVIFQQPAADGDGDVIGVERALDRKQPLAVLVFLADAQRLIGRAVKLLAQLRFDQRALFLDNDDKVEPTREVAQAVRLQRPGTGDLVEPESEIIGLDLVDSEIVQRLTHVEIGFADRDHADLRVGPARGDDLIEAIGADEGERRVELALLKPRLLRQHGIGRPDVQPAQRHQKIGGSHDCHAA